MSALNIFLPSSLEEILNKDWYYKHFWSSDDWQPEILTQKRISSVCGMKRTFIKKKKKRKEITLSPAEIQYKSSFAMPGDLANQAFELSLVSILTKMKTFRALHYAYCYCTEHNLGLIAKDFSNNERGKHFSSEYSVDMWYRDDQTDRVSLHSVWVFLKSNNSWKHLILHCSIVYFKQHTSAL